MSLSQSRKLCQSDAVLTRSPTHRENSSFCDFFERVIPTGMTPLALLRWHLTGKGCQISHVHRAQVAFSVPDRFCFF